MAEISIEQLEVVVRLNPLEKVGAVSGDVHVPRSAVREVRVVSHPFAELRGMRAPGTGWPGWIALGTWRRRGGKKDFVAIRRGREAVLVELDERSSEYGRLLVSVDQPDETTAHLGMVPDAAARDVPPGDRGRLRSGAPHPTPRSLPSQ